MQHIIIRPLRAFSSHSDAREVAVCSRYSSRRYSESDNSRYLQQSQAVKASFTFCVGITPSRRICVGVRFIYVLFIFVLSDEVIMHR